MDCLNISPCLYYEWVWDPGDCFGEVLVFSSGFLGVGWCFSVLFWCVGGSGVSVLVLLCGGGIVFAFLFVPCEVDVSLLSIFVFSAVCSHCLVLLVPSFVV